MRQPPRASIEGSQKRKVPPRHPPTHGGVVETQTDPRLIGGSVESKPPRAPQGGCAEAPAAPRLREGLVEASSDPRLQGGRMEGPTDPRLRGGRLAPQRLCAALLCFALTGLFALLVYFAWQLESRAALAAPWLWRSIYSSIRRAVGLGTLSEHPYMACVPEGSPSGAEFRYALGWWRPAEKMAGLSGGGNGAGSAPGDPRRKQKPPLLAGVSLYSAHGPKYDPAFPDGAVAGVAGGYGGNLLIHSLAHRKYCARSGVAPYVTPKERDARPPDPKSELELQVCWILIVEEPGGDTEDGGVI